MIGVTPWTQGSFFYFLGPYLWTTSHNTRWMDIHEVFRIWTQEAIGYTVSCLSRLLHALQTRRGGGFRSRSASCYQMKSKIYLYLQNLPKSSGYQLYNTMQCLQFYLCLSYNFCYSFMVIYSILFNLHLFRTSKLLIPYHTCITMPVCMQKVKMHWCYIDFGDLVWTKAALTNCRLGIP